MDRLLKLIRFSEVKIETCYYYKVNTSLLQLEIINEGIPQYINHPTKTYAQNSFFNMISTLELHKIGDFIEMHMELIKSNFQLSEKDILLRMKVEFSKAIELPLVIEIIDIFVRSTKKWKHHIEQFYKEIDIRLSKLLIDKSNEDGTKDNQYQLMSEKSRKKRLLHEIGFILMNSGFLKYGKKRQALRLLAPLINLDITDEDVEKSINDESNNYSKTLKETRFESWHTINYIKNFYK